VLKKAIIKEVRKSRGGAKLVSATTLGPEGQFRGEAINWVKNLLGKILTPIPCHEGRSSPGKTRGGGIFTKRVITKSKGKHDVELPADRNLKSPLKRRLQRRDAMNQSWPAGYIWERRNLMQL